MSFDACPCCHRRDGLTSGGCLYCSTRTYCAACGKLVACGCGHEVDAHACPSVIAVGTYEVIPLVSVIAVGTYEAIPLVEAS